MKISNSKKQLAKIIHENGGWRDGAEWSAQDSKKDAYPCRVCFYSKKPAIKGTQWRDGAAGMVGDSNACIEGVNQIPNWHQTILSRDEYFYLHPAPDADGWIKWGGGECPVGSGVVVDLKWSDGFEPKAAKPEAFRWQHLDSQANIIAYRLHKPEQAKPAPEPVAEAKPTIEQLAADYRNRKDFADRKQQEADAAKADADVKLAELVAAGEALGLVLSVAAPKYADRFYNAELGESPEYNDDVRMSICENCGNRFGLHYEDESYCKPLSERENA